MRNWKNWVAIAALLWGALAVVAGFALNAEHNSPSPVAPSKTYPDSTSTSLTETPRATTHPSRTQSSTSTGPTSTGSPSNLVTTTEKPTDRSTCPVTTDGHTKCPDDPYCPGGEFCPGDSGKGDDQAAIDPSTWYHDQLLNESSKP